MTDDRHKSKPPRWCPHVIALAVALAIPAEGIAGATTSGPALDVVDALEDSTLTPELLERENVSADARPGPQVSDGVPENPKRASELVAARTALERRSFDELDLDGRNGITRDEWLGFPYLDDLKFSSLDADANGSIDRSEYLKYGMEMSTSRTNRSVERSERGRSRGGEDDTTWRDKRTR